MIFEWIHRLEDHDGLRETAEHGGEIVALWALSGALESTLVEPFRPDYQELLEAARNPLLAGHDPDPLLG
ncbi:MAG: hypothetical protein M3046_00380 [Actinomycetota bacterium]|nr:hypothetical protein [Actinomycetota bacterium]